MPELVAEPEHKDIERELSRTGTMGLLQHLEELRKCIIHSLAAVGICFLGLWYFADTLLKYMVWPVHDALAKNHLDPVVNYTSPTDPININLSLGFIAALFVACPYVLYQVW